jgi:hypothetical protein
MVKWIIGIVIAAVVGIGIGYMIPKEVTLGGTSNFDDLAVTSLVSTGAITGASVGSVNGASTSTVAVGSSASSKAGAVCVWNGASFTIIRYASNATSTAFSTSTSCQ